MSPAPYKKSKFGHRHIQREDIVEHNQYLQGTMQTDMVLPLQYIRSRLREKQRSLLSGKTGEESKVIGNNIDDKAIHLQKNRETLLLRLIGGM